MKVNPAMAVNKAKGQGMETAVVWRLSSRRELEVSPFPTASREPVQPVQEQEVPEGRSPKSPQKAATREKSVDIRSPDPSSTFGITLSPRTHLALMPKAGHLSHCLENWRLITTDPWVLQVVKGYRLEFTTTPWQGSAPRQIPFGGSLEEKISKEVQELCRKQAVKRVTAKDSQFLSQIFLVPKKDGSQRPVVNLKPLNRFVTRQKFKMEEARLIRDLLRRGDWMVTIDLN